MKGSKTKTQPKPGYNKYYNLLVKRKDMFTISVKMKVQDIWFL